MALTAGALRQNSWQQDKRWSDRFLPEIKSILGTCLIGEPPCEDDQERNTDLIVLKMEAVRIACRVRRYAQLEKYYDQFTIRSGRPSGTKTELTKIIEGWGDYFFYGFSDETENSLIIWYLADLKVFRVWFMRKLIENKGKLPGMAQKNKDNSSVFHAFTFDELPPNFIIKSKQGKIMRLNKDKSPCQQKLK